MSVISLIPSLALACAVFLALVAPVLVAPDPRQSFERSARAATRDRSEAGGGRVRLGEAGETHGGGATGPG